jgi:hypothetical protein
VVSRLLAALARRASFANVVSLIALFVALGSGAYAVTVLPANSVGAAQLKKNSVGARALQANSTGSSELRPGAVHKGDLERGAITSRALQQGAVTQGALANGAVTQAALSLGAVGQAALGLNAVTPGAIAQGAVTPSALADNAVTSDKIAQSAVGAPQIKDGTLAPQEFTANGLPEVGYSSRELGASPESVPSTATNAGVLNLDIPAGTSGYTTSSGVVGAVAPSRLVANAQVVLHANVNTMFQCRLSLFHAGVLDQKPFAAGTNGTGVAGNEVALPLAGGLDVDPGSYNVRVQCFTFPDPAGSASFIRGSLTVSIAPR